MLSCPECGWWGFRSQTLTYGKAESGAGGDRPFVDLLPDRASVTTCRNPDCNHIFTKERKM
jgi:hypothetical protein